MRAYTPNGQRAGLCHGLRVKAGMVSWRSSRAIMANAQSTERPVAESILPAVAAESALPAVATESSVPAVTTEVVSSQVADDMLVQQPTEAGAWTALFALATLGFALVTIDVFAPQSLHLLASLDNGAHSYVSANFTYEFRYYIAHKLFSASFIIASGAGWLWCLYKSLQPNRRKLLPAVMLPAGAMYFLTGGSIKHGDPMLIRTLKDQFHRTRPDITIHSNYSFPSGHTTAAVFMTGALLFVLLPKIAPDACKSKWLTPEKRALYWFLSFAVTAGGRVAADVHWCTDTMAGACLAVMLVCMLSAWVEPLTEQTESADQKTD